MSSVERFYPGTLAELADVWWLSLQKTKKGASVKKPPFQRILKPVS
jgi:hypothetical protein